jgi:5-methyltetrahydropteroyltriglutamate--homocysteine methyltransferase
MSTLQPPFRAEHIGSLLRPPALLHARDEFATGAIDRQRLTAAENEAIRNVVKLRGGRAQVVTDGGSGAPPTPDSFTISGISGVSVGLTEDTGFTAPPLRPPDESAFKVVKPHQWKVQNAAISASSSRYDRPRQITARLLYIAPGRPRQYHRAAYPDLDAFWSDLTAAYGQECAHSRRWAAPICRSTDVTRELARYARAGALKDRGEV